MKFERSNLDRLFARNPSDVRIARTGHSPLNSFALVLIAVAVVNPPRLALRLGSHDRSKRFRSARIGVACAGGGVLGLAAVAHPLIDTLDVSPETFQIAAGLVITVVAVVDVVWPDRRPEQLVGGWRDGLVPVAYPLLLSPGLVLFSLTTAVDRGVWVTVGIGAVGLVGGLVASALSRERHTLWVAAVRLIASALVVLGVAMVMDGIRTV
jgi:small neutral amino acid transporter SnatA (MarC family)